MTAKKRKWVCCGCGNTVRKELIPFDGRDGVLYMCKSSHYCVKRQNKQLDKQLKEYHKDVVDKVNELSGDLSGDAGWHETQVRHALVELIDMVAHPTLTADEWCDTRMIMEPDQ